MLQISNCRLFFLSTSRSSFPLTLPVKKPFLSSYSSSSSPLFNPKTPIKPSSFPTVFSSSFRRERNNNNNNNHSLRSGSRNKSTTRDNNKGRKEKADLKMEESSSGFNKRRAEGKDKDDRPKTLQLKVRKLNPINTISYVQILGTGMDTQDTSPSVFLFFDKQRFIFNSGEGLQRFCTEHKIKLSKIDHIFFSRVCSETAGGLPGLLLTLAGMGEEGMSVKIWGSSDLKYLVDAMRSFIPNASMVHTHSFGPTPNADGAALSGLEKFTDPIVLLDDEVVKISAVLLWPSCSKASQLMDDGSFMSNSSSMGSEVKRNQLFGVLLPHTKNQERREGSVLKPGDISVIYVCELPEIKGKFDPAKAVALGLKPGPKYRELQLGNSVMSDRRNIMVHPSDVLGPSIPGPIVIIVDCPTPSHLQELLSIQSLNNYYADSADKQGGGPKSVNCVIHLSPSSVTMTSNYQNWMRRFVGAQHIMAGHEIKNMEIPILKSSARIAARLNYVCPQFFPAPGVWSAQQHTHSTSESNALSEGIFPKNSESILAENLLKFHLRPYTQLGLDKSGIPSILSSTDIVNELVAEIPEIADAVEQVNELWRSPTETGNLVLSKNVDVVMTEEPWMNAEASIPNINLGKQVNGESGEMQLPFSNSMRRDEVEHDSNLPSCLDNISREDLEIVLLGTGSSQPSKYRNVSSVFVNLFSKGTLLLDCGEGTLGQLRRRFGVKGADKAIRNLRFIWISHIHADHHSGLARILALRQELLRDVPHEPLLVIGPRQLKRFLDAYQRLETLDMQFLDCRNTTEASWTAFEEGNQCDQESAVASGKINKKNEAGGIAQNIEMSLFAKGSRMQSYWKTPGSPVDFAAGFEILRKLEVVLGEAGLEVLTSIPVVHCPQAFGVVIKASERINTAGKTIPGWKLVYSGDTRPCPELIDASRGATILIHEATFEDGMVEEAIAKNHSTTKEAIEVGDSAGAYRIILTHFSQRYPKIPVLNEIHMHKTCIGFDLMSINIADLPVLPRVLPYLKLLFRNDMAFDESDGVADP